MTKPAAHPILQALVDLVVGVRDDGQRYAFGEDVPQALREKCLKWLYDMLTILDSKTNQLLSANSFVLAATAFLARSGGDTFSGAKAFYILPLVLAMVCLISAAWRIYRVRWGFLDYMHRTNCAVPTHGFWLEANALAEECARRTGSMRMVRFFTIAAAATFIFASAAVFREQPSAKPAPIKTGAAAGATP